MVISSSNFGVANGVSKRNQQCGNWGSDADAIDDGWTHRRTNDLRTSVHRENAKSIEKNRLGESA